MLNPFLQCKKNNSCMGGIDGKQRYTNRKKKHAVISIMDKNFVGGKKTGSEGFLFKWNVHQNTHPGAGHDSQWWSF